MNSPPAVVFNGYDAASNLTSRVTPANQTILYAYDALNRLDLKTLPGAVTVDYVYDPGIPGTPGTGTAIGT